jgi:hypothetical protein
MYQYKYHTNKQVKERETKTSFKSFVINSNVVQLTPCCFIRPCFFKGVHSIVVK